MTKEELEKEAEEKYNERLKQNGIKIEYRNGTYVDGYMDSAEPREKRIEELETRCNELFFQVNEKIAKIDELEETNNELERKLEQTEKDLADYQFNYPTIKELEKENAELKKEVEYAETHCLYHSDCPNKKENAELKEQNGKLLESCEGATMMYEDLCKAKEIIKNIIRVTWGEGWNYSLDWKVKAEQFLNNKTGD